MNFRLERRQKIQADHHHRCEKINENRSRLENVVDDKSVIAEYAQGIQTAGSTEAAREIQRAIGEMKGEVDTQYQKNTDIYNHALNQLKAEEEEIKYRALQARQDARLAEQAAGQIRQTNGAKESLHQAQVAAAEETSLLEQYVHSDTSTRKKAQNDQAYQTAKYNNCQINYIPTRPALPPTVDVKQYGHFVADENYHRVMENTKQIEKEYLNARKVYAAPPGGNEAQPPYGINPGNKT